MKPNPPSMNIAVNKCQRKEIVLLGSHGLECFHPTRFHSLCIFHPEEPVRRAFSLHQGPQSWSRTDVTLTEPFSQGRECLFTGKFGLLLSSVGILVPGSLFDAFLPHQHPKLKDSCYFQHALCTGKPTVAENPASMAAVASINTTPLL